MLTIAGAPPPPLTPKERIERGKVALDQLEYESAAEEMTIVAVSKDATLEEQVEANLYAGIAHRVLGRDVDAKLNFVFVLTHAPETKLPANTTPKIQNFYDLIRLEVERTRRVEKQVDSPAPTASSTLPDETASATTTAESKPAGAASPVLISLAIAGAGGVAALVAGGIALGADVALGAADTSRGTKEAAYIVGYPSLAMAAVGAAVAVGGAAFAGVALVME